MDEAGDLSDTSLRFERLRFQGDKRGILFFSRRDLKMAGAQNRNLEEAQHN